MPRSPTRRASGAASARRSARTPSARSAARKRGSAASTSMPAKRTGPRRLCASTTRWFCGGFREACVARRLADYDREHHLALGGRGLPAPRGIVTRLQRPAKGRGSSHTCSSSRRPARPPSTTCAPSPRWSVEASGRLAWLAAWRRTTASTTWPWRTWRPCGTQRPSALPLRPPVARTEVADPPGLWRSFREALRAEFLRAVGTLDAAEDAGLAEVQDLLPAEQNSSTDYGLAAPRIATEPACAQRLLRKALRFDAREHAARADSPRAEMNAEQVEIYDAVVAALQTAARSASAERGGPPRPLRAPVAVNRGRRPTGSLARLPRGALRRLPPRGRHAAGHGGRRARRAPGRACG